MGDFIQQLGHHYEPNIISTVGLLITVTFLGSKLFQRLGVPQVVGFIVVGVLLGTSFLTSSRWSWSTS
jgi:Kef-type K+ transport system membrane component KefB